MLGAGIRWVDERIPGLIDEMAERLRAIPEIAEAWLFGSWAWGRPNPRSDIDVLIILEYGPHDPKARRAIVLDALWDLRLNLDLVVLTRAEASGNKLAELARRGRRLV
mgnify:CR=1 FL=1